MPEEEVSKRVLPDHLTNNLDIIIVSLIYVCVDIRNYSSYLCQPRINETS